ncbi:MAG: O-antigen ligase family protein [Gemmatimonadota bacterium]|nr:O-antigen ligase family protein [Gemmatimonadota bacterium]MDP6801945.1 O-antigen ligase family protein [Gemmatimonadota bacterium]MDP7032366.1 O-antigen ligase family protein [Gemmatimonadota bacterium]
MAAVVIAMLALGLGSAMEVGVLVATLGLFNVGVVLFLLLRRDITWGFLFYLTAVIFFQTGFWIRLPNFPDLYPARIVSTLLYLIFLIQVLIGMRRVPRLSGVERNMIVFLIVLFISVVTSGQQPRWLMILRGYVYPFMFFYFARTVINRDRQIAIVLGYLVLIGLYLGVMGIFEKAKLYSLIWPQFIVDESLRDTGLSRLGFRVRGIFLQPAILGTVMAMGFFPAWYVLSRQGGIIRRVAQLGLVLVTPPVLFFTQTRSVYAGFAVALITGAIWGRRLRVLCLALLLFAMVGVFLNWDNMATDDRDRGGLMVTNTIEFRAVLFMEAMEVFADHPFFGCGFMNFPELAMQYRRPRDVPLFGHIDLGVGGHAIPHNIFLTIIAEQGIAGILPYFLIFWLMFRTSIRAYRGLGREGLVSKDLVVCIWCGIAAYMVNAMFLEMRYFEYVNVLFFFLMGTVAGMEDRLRAQAGSSGPDLTPYPVPAMFSASGRGE